jgi:dienelactone hydrolase
MPGAPLKEDPPMKSLALPLLTAWLMLPAAASAQSHFARHNPPGPYTVGLHVIEQYDQARAYRGGTDINTGKPTTGERARPIQTLVWYPAAQATSSAMTAGDYLRLGGISEAFAQTPLERTRAQDTYINDNLSALTPERAAAESSAKMTAYRDADARPGRFPVIVYAPSFDAPSFENADLCEYLASFGYIVISSPSHGQSVGGMTTDLEGASAQMDDIEFLIGYAQTLPDADTGHIAAVGYSWGGLANVMAAAKDSRIDALVSLDGSVRSWPSIVEQSRFLTPDRITVPLLYVASAPKQIEDLPAGLNTETSFLNKAKYADLYRVTLAPYIHADFGVMLSQRFAADSDYGDYDQAELSVANDWMETYVRHFLDGYLKSDAAGLAFLDLPTGQTGAPAHLLSVYQRKAQGVAPTRAAFAAELARQGFDRASVVYKAFQARDPGFTLTDLALTTWGYALLHGGETLSAVAIFRLDTELYPQSWNAWDSLGEAYAQNGDRGPAVEAYRKSLGLNPDNANGKAQLAKQDVKRAK